MKGIMVMDGTEKLYFPLFVDLTKKNILIVGGGSVAARRVRTLLPFVSNLTVVAPRLLEELSSENRLCLLIRPFCDSDLEGRDMVLACTDDGELNHRIVLLCRERHIPVNNASRREENDFTFPSVAREGSLVVGVTTGGDDIPRTMKVRRQIESMIGAEKEQKEAEKEKQRI